MAVMRLRFRWSGFTGSPGYTTLYALDTVPAQTFADGAETFMQTVLSSAGGVNLIPAGVSITPETIVESFDPITGDLLGTAGIIQLAQISGVGTGNWSSVTGACLTWNTGDFIAGRRVRGRVFLVPLSGVAFDTTGTLSAAMLSAQATASTAYITSAIDPVVWHRPVNNAGGKACVILSSTMRDKPAILTSRRD